MDKDFLQAYRHQLKQVGQQVLSYEALTECILDAAELSTSEQHFFQQALRANPQNMERFITVFDETLALEDELKNLRLDTQVLENGLSYFKGEGWEIGIDSKNGETLLKAKAFPKESKGQRVGITVQPIGQTVRILALGVGENVAIGTIGDVGKIQSIELQYAIHDEVGMQAPVLPFYRQKKYWISSLIAAVFAILLGIIWILQQRGGGDEPSLFPNEKEIAQESAAYVPNPILERFIDRNVRGPQQGIDLIQPPVGERVGLPFDIKWSMANSINRIRLVLVDNTNTSLWETETTEREIQFVEEVPPGLYYLKFLSGEELLGIGKFIVAP